MKGPKRLRLAFGRRLSASSVAEMARELHAEKPLLRPEHPLPYPGLDAPVITATMAQRFVARCGEALQQAGMRRGDRVALFKRNEADYPLLSLAVIRAGGIAVPVNSKMKRDDLARHLRHAEARFLCCDAASFTDSLHHQRSLRGIEGWVFTDRAPDTTTARVVLSDAITELAGDEPPCRLAADDPIILAHTSGTTGAPKLVTSTAASFLAGIRAHYRTEPPLPWSRVGIAGPFSHLVYQIGLSTLLLSGMPAWTLSGDDADTALAAIEQKKINIFVAFPYLYLRMYARGLDSHDLRSMRVWVSVADASQEAHMAAFCRKGSPLGGSLFVEPLGSTEVGGPALRRVWTAANRIRCRRHVGRRMLGGPRVRVTDGAGRIAAAGEPGRLMVKGPTVFGSYWRSEKKGEDELEGWWATGDVVSRDRWGRHFHLDRESDVVSTAAGPFFTLPAEDVLHSYPGVYEAVVFGVPADDGHEVPAALAWVDERSEIEGPELMRWASERIGGKVTLASLTLLNEEKIPRGLTGKVQKWKLREAYAQTQKAALDA